MFRSLCWFMPWGPAKSILGAQVLEGPAGWLKVIQGRAGRHGRGERKTFFFPKQARQPAVTPQDARASEAMVRNKAKAGVLLQPPVRSETHDPEPEPSPSLAFWPLQVGFLHLKCSAHLFHAMGPASFFHTHALLSTNSGANSLPPTS